MRMYVWMYIYIYILHIYLLKNQMFCVDFILKSNVPFYFIALKLFTTGYFHIFLLPRPLTKYLNSLFPPAKGKKEYLLSFLNKNTAMAFNGDNKSRLITNNLVLTKSAFL